MKSKYIQSIVLAVGGNGLGAVWSLSQRRIRLGIITLEKDDVSQFSRYPVVKYCLVDEAEVSKERQILNILRDYEDKNIVLIPTSDRFVTFLNNNREYCEKHFRIVLPPTDLTEQLIDKALETKLISGILPIPRTVSEFPDSPSALLAELRLPIIVKPRSHKLSFLGKKNITLFSNQDVLTFYENHKNILYSLLGQEIIPGADKNLWVCNCTYDRSHALVTAFIFRRYRTAPAHYGVTSCAVSEFNEQILRYADQFGKATKYAGPAMLEFKFDERDNEYKYIELNPRIGMCNFFDTCCGVNNVYSAFQVASGWPVLKQFPIQKNGVVFLDFYDDFYARIHDGEKISSIFGEYVGIFLKKHVSLYFCWGDPFPAVVLSFGLLRKIFINYLMKIYKKMCFSFSK